MEGRSVGVGHGIWGDVPEDGPCPTPANLPATWRSGIDRRQYSKGFWVSDKAEGERPFRKAEKVNFLQLY